MMAVAVLAVALFGLMSGISYMRIENRVASQRMLVASVGAEMMELFKSLSYTDIRNSTTGAPVYLKGNGTATPNLSWAVPKAGQWQALPVEAVNPGSAIAPGLVADKIPQGVWTVQFVPDAVNPSLLQINLAIQWSIYPGSKRPPLNYALSTKICEDFPKL